MCVHVCVCTYLCSTILKVSWPGPALIDRGCWYLLTFSGWIKSQRKREEMEVVFLLALF